MERELQEFKYSGPPGSPRDGQRRLTLPTPSENKIMIEQDMHKHQIENLYSCCCFSGSTDRRLLTFLAQLGLSSLVMIFCIYKLSVEDSCSCHPNNNHNTFYSGVLMTILGIFLPSPRPLH
jgi:hypothetical protein